MAQFLWTQKQDVGPPARLGHAMSYEAARRRTTLFGGMGASTNLLADTWSWDGQFWTQLADIGPSGRRMSALAYDAARDRIVLFGGLAGASLADTWEWDGALWTQVADSGPQARFGHATAYDPKLKRIVLFGGAGVAGSLNDTWAWDGADWTQIADMGPSPRQWHAMTHAREPDALLLVGGFDGQTKGLGDTWTFDGRAWIQVADEGPGPVMGAGLADTPGGTILFGGGQSAGNVLAGGGAATWRYLGGRWTQVQDMGPGPRSRIACAFDEQRGVVVLFGGFPTLAKAGDPEPPATAAFGDTWEMPVAAAAPAPPVAAPAIVQVILSAPVLPQPQGSTLQVTVKLDGPTGPTPTTITAVILDPIEIQLVNPNLITVSQGLIPPLSDTGSLTITRVGPSDQPRLLRVHLPGAAAIDTPFSG